MEKNFFTLVNENFFSILTGKYKEINYGILLKINEAMQKESNQLERGRIIEIIDEYFDSMPNLMTFERDQNDELIDMKKNKSNILLDFEKYGWLSSEAQSFKQYYQMEPAALQILSAMKQAVDNDVRPIESTGYVHSIYDRLKNFNLDMATETVERLNDDSDDLSNNLRMINSKIRKHLNKLLKEDNKEPKKILNELLDDYQNNVVARSFNNLRRKDNPIKYKDAIIEAINKLKNEEMDKLVDNYIQVKWAGKRNADIELEARVFFNDVFNKIKYQFESIGENIRNLDNKNSQYVSSARSRVMFLLNDKENLEGKIDNILKLLEDKRTDRDEEFEFDLYELGKIDDTSLYTYQRNKRSAPSILQEEEVAISEEELEAYSREIMRLNQFTIVSVNKFLMDALGDKEYIEAKDIKTDTLDQFMMLFLSRIYSNEKIVEYQIEQLDNTFTYQDREIQNFKITRRAR